MGIVCAEDAPCAHVALPHNLPLAPRARAEPETAHVVCLCVDVEVGMVRRARASLGVR